MKSKTRILSAYSSTLQSLLDVYQSGKGADLLSVKGGRKTPKVNNEEQEASWHYDYDYTPTGKLKLLLLANRYHTSGKVLSDTSSVKLEDRLDEFFYKLEL